MLDEAVDEGDDRGRAREGGPPLLEGQVGAQVLAVDPTSFMRSILKLRRLASPQRGQLTVVDGAAESLPVAAGTIDALWTVNTVHHWTSVASAVGEMRRVLRPGGRVVLVDEDFDDPGLCGENGTKSLPL